MAKEMDPNNIELLKPLMDMDYIPAVHDVDTDLDNEYVKSFSLSDISALGAGFVPVISEIQKFILKEGKSGIYFVNTMGKSMFQKNGENAFIGTLKGIDGGVGGGLARISPVALGPQAIATMCIGAALLNVEHKLNNIERTQRELLEYFETKDLSELKGNLNVLGDIINNYKYNWDNETYKKNKHIKVQDIRQDSEQHIIQYRDLIAKKIKKKSLFHTQAELNNTMKDLKAKFEDYQLSLYLFAYSSFLEIMLLENFDTGYLNSTIKRIEEYEYNYRSLYKESYDRMEDYNKSAIESHIVNGISKASLGIGNIVAKIPKISDTQLDENLVEAGEKIKAYNENNIEKKMEDLIKVNSNVVLPFINNIKMIDDIYNNTEQIGFDKDKIYFKLKEA